MSSEPQDVWLLEVFHPSTLVSTGLGDHEVPAAWGLVGVFKTPGAARKAFEKLVSAGRISKDEAGNSWRLQRQEVRD